MNKNVNQITDFTDLFLHEKDRVKVSALDSAESAIRLMSEAFKAGYVEFLITNNEWRLTKKGAQEWVRRKRA